jgi:GNAT superfamily N-acetyltransferase
MVEADAEDVAQLAAELGYPSEIESIRTRMKAISGSDLLLVAVTAADRPIGFIQASRFCIIEAGFRVEILGLVVSSTARRSGIGRKLLAEAERWAQRIGIETVIVRSNTKRTEAHDFYPAMDYELIKTQAAYRKRVR